jgi:hypothetical protein
MKGFASWSRRTGWRCFARRVWLVLLFGTGAGCEAPGLGGEPPREVRWESPHFEYYTRAGETWACPAALDVLEQNFAALESYLGFAWPSGNRVTYNKYLDKQDYQAHAPCPEDSGGCAYDSTVESPRTFDQHELVHAYVAPSGNPPALFKEGLATALACHPSFSGSTIIPWQDALAVDQPIEELGVYATGSVMAHYLLREYGGEAFMQLYRSLGNRAGAEAVDKAMQETLGVSADAVWQMAQAEALDCLPIWPCSREALPLDGSTVVVEPRCGLTTDARTLALPAEGNLAFVTDGALDLASCLDGRGTSVYPLLSGDASLLTLMPLSAGRYFVEYSAVAGMQIAVRTLAMPSVGTDCESLAPYSIGADEYSEIAILAPPETDAWTVRLHFEGSHRLRLYAQPGDARLTICPDCDKTSAFCQTVDVTAEGLDVMWTGDHVLRVDTARSGQAATELHIRGR